MPRWERIKENGFLCDKTKDISLLLPSFRNGQVLRFTLLGCPAKKAAGEGKNSRRVILRGEEAQLGWLKRQGAKNGFAVLEAHIAGKAEQFTVKKSENEFHLSGVPFEGVLQINDADAFRMGFENGIGSEKAYGFGLLMVRKEA